MTPDNFPNIFVALLQQSLGLGGSETEIYLSTIMTLDGQAMETSDFSFLGEGVLSVDVQSASRAEFISFTGVDPSGVGLTGATRGLSFKNKTVIQANKKFHAVGAPVIIAFGTHNLIDLENIIINNLANVNAQIAALIVAIQEEYLALNGSNAPIANIPFGGFRIMGLGNAVNPQDAITLAQLSAAVIAGGVPATTSTGGYVKVATDTEFNSSQNTTVVGPFTFYNMATISQIRSGISASFTAGINFTGATTPQTVVWGNGQKTILGTVTATTIQTINGVHGSISVGVAVQLNTIETNIIISGVSVGANIVGSPSDSMIVSIQSDSGGVPSGTILASQTFTPTGSMQNVNFGTVLQLTAGTNYWVCYERTGSGDASNYYTLKVANVTTSAAIAGYDGTTWFTGQPYLPGGGVYVEFISGEIFPATSSTNLFVYGGGSTAQPTPSFLNYVGGFVNTTITIGNPILVIADGFLNGFTGLTVATEYYLQANSTLGTSGSLKAGRAVSATQILINRYS